MRFAASGDNLLIFLCLHGISRFPKSRYTVLREAVYSVVGTNVSLHYYTTARTNQQKTFRAHSRILGFMRCEERIINLSQLLFPKEVQKMLILDNYENSSVRNISLISLVDNMSIDSSEKRVHALNGRCTR